MTQESDRINEAYNLLTDATVQAFPSMDWAVGVLPPPLMIGAKGRFGPLELQLNVDQVEGVHWSSWFKGVAVTQGMALKSKEQDLETSLEMAASELERGLKEFADGLNELLLSNSTKRLNEKAALLDPARDGDDQLVTSDSE